MASTLSDEKVKIAQGATEPASPDNPDVAGLLEALKSVVPTAIAGAYTAAVVVSRSLAQTQGASDRAELQTKLAKAGQAEEAIKKMLEQIPDESRNLVFLRWLVFGVAIVAVLIATIGAARSAEALAKKKRFPAAELAVAEVAFVAWALAMPGTPLAAYHSAATLSAITVAIAACAGLLIGAVGKLVLTKPAAERGAKATERVAPAGG